MERVVRTVNNQCIPMFAHTLLLNWLVEQAKDDIYMASLHASVLHMDSIYTPIISEE